MTADRPSYEAHVTPAVYGVLVLMMAMMKMVDFDGYVQALAAFDAVRGHEHRIATNVVFAELVAGVPLLLGAATRARLYATYIVGALFGILVSIFYVALTFGAYFGGESIANDTGFGVYIAQEVSSFVLLQNILMLLGAAYVATRVVTLVRQRVLRNHGERRALGKATRWFVRTGVVVLAARALLPYVIEAAIDDALRYGGKTSGRVGDVDVALHRGAYRLEDVVIDKRGDSAFEAAIVDIGLDWSALFSGDLGSKVELIRPRFGAVLDDSSGQIDLSPSVGRTVRALAPLEPERVLVKNGSIRFMDRRIAPAVEVEVDRIYLTASGLGGRSGRIDLGARVADEGRLLARADFDLSTNGEPTAHVQARLAELPLASLADFTNAYAGFAFDGGRLDFHTELRIADGRVRGFAKPILSSHDDDDLETLSLAWNAFVGVSLEVFDDTNRGRFETRIPLDGRLGGQDPWSTAGDVLSNAFLQALMPQIDRAVSLNDVVEGKRPEAT